MFPKNNWCHLSVSHPPPTQLVFCGFSSTAVWEHLECFFYKTTFIFIRYFILIRSSVEWMNSLFSGHINVDFLFCCWHFHFLSCVQPSFSLLIKQLEMKKIWRLLGWKHIRTHIRVCSVCIYIICVRSIFFIELLGCSRGSHYAYYNKIPCVQSLEGLGN